MGRLLGQFFAPDYVQETPSGTVNGSNQAFALTYTPAAIGGLVVLLDGIPQVQTTEYTLAGQTVTFASAPLTGQTVFAFYVR